MKTRSTLNPLTELVTQLRQFAARCRSCRWLGALFHVGVALDIAADAVRAQSHQATDAYTAEQADLEAVKLIHRVCCAGHVSKTDLPLLTAALRHIHNSARRDHAIAARAQA